MFKRHIFCITGLVYFRYTGKMEYLTIVKREYAVKQIRLSFFDSGLHLMFRRLFLDEEENMNKRRISFVIVLAMVFLLFSGFVPDRAKADDVMVSYTDHPLNTDWVSYQLVGGSPSQYLRVVLPSAGRLWIETRSFTEARMYFYNSDLTSRIIDNKYIYGEISEPKFNSYDNFFEAGEYYIRLESRMNKGVAGRLDLKLSFEDSGSNEISPNGTYQNAMPIYENTEINGVITYFDEYDYYKFELSRENRINIGMYSYCKKLRSELLDSDLKVIGEISNDWYDASKEEPKYFDYLDILSPGTYYIRVKSGGYSGEYKLKYNIVNQIKKIRIKKVKKLYVGDKKKLKAIISPKNATLKNVIWASSDSWLAEVNDRGVLVAKNTGTVEITATARDGSNVVGRIKIKIVRRK